MNHLSIATRTALALLVATELCSAQGPAASALFPAVGTDPSFDLPASLRSPFAPGESRVQQLFGLDPRAAHTLTFQEVELRYDGPARQQPTAHSIPSIEVRVGVTSVGVDEASASFDDNLDRPLLLVESVTMRAIQGDLLSNQVGTWGGPAGELRFRAASPITLTVPPGGSLVLDLRVDGGNGTSEPATLDLDDEALTLDPVRSGVEVREGIGCPGPQGTRVEIDVLGDFALGGSIRFGGFGYGAQAPVAVFIGPHLLPQRLQIPGTPMCWTDLDLSTSLLADVPVTQPDGTLEPGERPPLPIPRLPQLCGQKLYVQAGSPVTPTTQNPTGLVTSNYRTITIGCPIPSKTRSAVLANWSDREATVAEVSRPGGFAVRMR